MADPILRAKTCPPSILARTRNARSAKERAEKAGWTASATYAISPDGDQGILLRLVWPDGTRMSALWTGPLGQVDRAGNAAGLGFDGAWRRIDGRVERLTYGALSALITDPRGTYDPPPNKTQVKNAEDDQEAMINAIGLMLGDGAAMLGVKNWGTDTRQCSGKVMQRDPFGSSSRPCQQPVDQPDDSLCKGPCSR